MGDSGGLFRTDLNCASDEGVAAWFDGMMELVNDSRALIVLEEEPRLRSLGVSLETWEDDPGSWGVQGGPLSTYGGWSETAVDV